ncbi:MAG TPA: LLM class flavin-dependent oxidoreductase [Nitrososphaeraceae archaeon]
MISLGTAVIDMFFDSSIMLAKRYATLDILSQGRVISGLDLGWSIDEYQASNLPFQNRAERADEFIQAMRKIWTDDVVEFKEKYYKIPASIIGPKPIQKPHIPVYLGGFSSNTFSRIVKYDLNGWLGVGAGPLENIENCINIIKENATKSNKNPDHFRTIILTYPNVKDDKSSSSINKNRLLFSGGIDQIGSDIQRIKDMGVDHIVFGYNFVPIGRDVPKVIKLSKELSKFARRAFW